MRHEDALAGHTLRHQHVPQHAAHGAHEVRGAQHLALDAPRQAREGEPARAGELERQSDSVARLPLAWHAEHGRALFPTMIADLDIWRCAQLMINNHGDEAALEAAATADEWLSKGNIEAQRVWMRIARAIDDLRTIRPGEPKQ